MWKYILKRILFLIPIMLLSSFIVYYLMSLTGDPAQAMLGEDATEEQLEQLREEMGLNDPLIVRYGRYIGNVVFHGDLGTDIWKKSVFDEYMARLPYTLYLACVSMFLTALISVPLGIIAAVRQNKWEDFVLSALAIAGMSIPNFWLGLLLMIKFALQLSWLPTSGAEDGVLSLILPAFCTAVPNAALITRMTRSSMLDCIRADYLRTARAKGVKEGKIILKHALGNAIIPILTSMSNQFAILIGGSVVVETVFAWPGVGSLIINAVKAKNTNMVTGGIIMTTVFVAVILLLVDLLYAFLDPRIKAQYQGK
ncbi:MAG: ABC transporter permease [Lachnospiraceae bacterium]|nr:ABC transporter permease [Lachnospiraceae bacterium]MBQ6196017.1 ABC transporter permease [Lachnospiraceae bacterium]